MVVAGTENSVLSAFTTQCKMDLKKRIYEHEKSSKTENESEPSFPILFAAEFCLGGVHLEKCVHYWYIPALSHWGRWEAILTTALLWHCGDEGTSRLCLLPTWFRFSLEICIVPVHSCQKVNLLQPGTCCSAPDDALTYLLRGRYMVDLVQTTVNTVQNLFKSWNKLLHE